MNCLSVNKKLDIIHKVERGEKKIEVCRKFNIPPSTLSTILRNRQKIKAFGRILSKQKIRICTYDRIDKAILEWIRTVREKICD